MARIGAMVYRTTIYGLSSTSFNAGVPWDSESYDDAGIHDSTNPSRLTVPVGVDRVRVGCNAAFANVDNNISININIALNGNTAYQFRAAETPVKLGESTQQPRVSLVTGPVLVEEGDYFEVFISASGETAFDLDYVLSNFYLEAV